ncbi:MAG: hypothetical protein E7621_00550 [Ruminococcaceae bacterium]|nr:hypothetical protein [Oscillospiraceae bacterium]
MKKKQNKNKELIQKSAFGAVFSACACALLLIGGIFEILDMTASALASLAVLITYLEFGFSTALSVYAVSSILSFILNPVATSNVYYILLLGYFPVAKLIIDNKFKNIRPLRALLKFLIFNIGCAAILFIFFKLTGADKIMQEFTIGALSPRYVIIIIFALLNLFLVLYDRMISVLSVLYIRVLRRRFLSKR